MKNMIVGLVAVLVFIVGMNVEALGKVRTSASVRTRAVKMKSVSTQTVSRKGVYPTESRLTPSSRERINCEQTYYDEIWQGVAANGSLIRYVNSPNDYPQTREELEGEKRRAMEERERLHAEWAVPKLSSSSSEEEHLKLRRDGVESREWPKVGETGVILTSWYGPGFDGKPTASGEKFDMNEISAAHKDWPIGTKVLLRNMENGLTVIVVINDRGPYYEERELDLSLAAAEALGMVDEGVVWLEYQILKIPSS